MKNRNLFQLILTFFLLGNIQLFAQNEVFQYQKESFQRNYEVDYSKGKTNVQIPLLNVPTNKTDLNISVGLSYNTDNVSIHNMAGDTGLGWNIMTGGVITKFLNLGLNDHTNNIYQYNFPGKSGRFYIKYDTSIGGIRAVEDYPSKNKIIIVKESDSIFAGFKIIDENGFKYVFDKKNISYRYTFSDPQSSPIGHGAGLYPPAKKNLYTSAFYLTKILDEKDNVLADYEYDVSTKTITTDGKQIVKNKLSKINIANIGSITFNYGKQPLLESSNEDNYLLGNVILKNKGGQVINQYSFEYATSIVTGKRILHQIIQKDKNNNDLNKYSFTYHSPETNYYTTTYDLYGYNNTFDPCYIDYDNFYSFKSINPHNYKTDFLKSVTFPSGGKTEYDYEPNTYEIAPYSASITTAEHNYSDFEIVKLNEINFSTKTVKLYPFTINNPQNYSKFLIKMSYDYLDQTSYPHPSYEFRWKIQKSSLVNDTISRSNYINPVTLAKCENVKELKIGSNTSFILNVGVYVYGKAEVFGVKKTSRNFRYAKGGRISKIRTYENNSSLPVKVLDFNYGLFTDLSRSSGVSYLDVPLYDVPYTGHVTSEGDDFRNDQEMILYKNVKVTDSIKNTSTRYTFLMPEEIDTAFGSNPDNEVFSFDHNNVIKKMGLTKKTEQFDANNQLVEKTETQNNPEYVIYNNIVDSWNQPLKLLWIKSINSNNQVTVNGSNILESTQQRFFEPDNNLFTKQIVKDFSGSVTESNIYYPKDLNNQKLLNANILGVALKSEVLQDGQLVSKSETKFDNPATVYPTSKITYNMQTQGTQTVGSIESYDEVGNVREVKSKNGISTVTIWGYHKTLPIAVIVGSTYAEIQNLSVVTAAIEASNQDNDNPVNEPALISALDNLRRSPELINAQVTTYTYDPLIGVTSATLPSGMREVNVYDNANRLLKVMDINGKKLREFKYHYKN